VHRHCFNGEVALSQIYSWARAGRLPVVRIGRRVFFSPAALNRFIQTGGEDGKEETAA